MIVWIRIVLYGRSLAVHPNSGRLGGLDLIQRQANIKALLKFDRLIESFVVFAGWSFERSSSSSGNGRLVLGQSSSSGDGRLVLATVVWFWRRSSGSSDSPLLAAVPVPP